MVRVRCSHCPQTYQVPEEKLGSQVICQRCQRGFTFEMAPDEADAPRAKPSSAAKQSGRSTSIPGKLGPYLLQRKLGAGAMGEVWLAHDSALERDAALKLMAPGVASDPERRQRFEREAKTAARLLHPNTVAIYSFGVEGEHAYLAMELVEGSSLDKIVSASDPLPWRQATRVICDAANGLAAAHEIGLVHRDVKPANLMRTSKGVTKVVDFGLARGAMCNTQLTQDGTLLGTPAFMAPEQWMGTEVDARSDLYSLICSYYFLLTGRLPFGAPSLPSLGYQHRYEPFPDPRQWIADLPDRVCRILVRGAQKDPADRYQTAVELVSELESLLDSPEQSLLYNRPWQDLIASLDTNADVASADRPLPAVVASPRLGKWIGRSGHPLRWVGVLVTGGFVVLLGTIVYKATNHGTIQTGLSDPAADLEVGAEDDTAVVDPKKAEEIVEPPLTVSRTATIVRGDWETTADELIQHDTSRSFPVLLFGDHSWQDYDFSVDAMRIKGNDQFALYFRADGPSSLYWFGLAEWQNTVAQLGVKWSGKEAVLQKQGLPLQNDHWYTARVRIRGQHVECTLSDGPRILHTFELDDSRHPTGRVGLRTCCSAYRFRNIKVTAPDGKTLWEGPPVIDRNLPDPASDAVRPPTHSQPDPTIPAEIQRLKEKNLPGTSALQFDGLRSRVRIPRSNFKFFGDTSLTIEAVVVPRGPTSEIQAIMSDLSGGAGFHLAFRKAWQFGYFPDSPNIICVRHVASVVAGQRIHLAAVYDKEGRELRLFVDGRLNNAVLKITQPYRESPWDTIIGADPNHPQPKTFAQLFAGLIEQVSISKTARYSTDFEPERVLRRDQHTVVLYHFNEGEGNTAYDSSGKGNHASIEGAQWIQTGK